MVFGVMTDFVSTKQALSHPVDEFLKYAFKSAGTRLEKSCKIQDFTGNRCFLKIST